MIIAILDRVRSMYNVGSFFRTCDGAAIDKLFLTGYTPTPPRTPISKTALGAEEHVPWEYREDLLPLVQELKQQGITVYAVETSPEAKPYHEMSYIYPCAFIFGNEVDGVDQQILQEVDGTVIIPMLGKKHSLNVATTAGIILYDAKLKSNKQ